MGVIAPERIRRPPGEEPPPRRPRVPWGLIAFAAVVAAVVFFPSWLLGLLPGIPNPFAEETVDRSRPAVLQSIRDLRELRAASGHFEVIVDLEKDTAFPRAILGSRTLFVGVGDVDAVVGLSSLDEDAVEVSGDRRSATITLPAPRLSDARLDLEQSYVYDRELGILDEIGLLFQDEADVEREVYLLAEERIEEAAAESPGIAAQAEQNTRAVLEGLLRSLGFTSVEIRFES